MPNLGPQLINQSYQDLLQITSSNAVQKGDGTSVSSLAITSSTTSGVAPAITGNTNDRVLTATGGQTINGEANLTFNGSDLTVAGNVNSGNTVDTVNLTVNGYVNTNLTPTDNSFSQTLGESSRTWNQVHVGTSDGSKTAFFGEDVGFNPGKLFIKTDGSDLTIRANQGITLLGDADIGTIVNNTTLTNIGSITTPSLVSTNIANTNSASFGGSFTPTARIHVSGSGNNRIRIQSNPTNEASLDFKTDSTTNDFGLRIVREAGTNGNSTIGHKGTGALYIAALDTGSLQLATDNTTRVFVSGSGLVGIGTTTPGVELDVIGSIRANSTMFNSTTQTTRIRINSTTHLAFQNTSSVEVARFDNAGNWGIGTTSPQRRLHVDASGSSNTNVPLVLTSVDTNNRVGILFASSSLSAGRQHNLFHRVNAPNAEWILGANAGENATWNFVPRDDTNYTIQLSAPFNGGTARISTGISQSLFSLGAGGTGNQHLNISSSGRVGVGTTTPRELFSVGGGNIALDAARYIDFGSGNSRVRDLGQISGQGYPLAFETFGPIAVGAPNNCTEKMRLTGSGSLGLGTTNPLARLHVSASDGNEFFRITSGSQNILNIRSGSAVFFAGTGTAPNSGFDLDIQGTGTANGGSVRIAGWGTIWEFTETAKVYRTSTGNANMFSATMGGAAASGIQNPLIVQFDANQSATAGYTVLRLNATHTAVGSGAKLLQTWEFNGSQRSVVNITGSIGVGITTPSASIHISSSLGLPPMLALTPHHPLPTTNIPTGSFMVSASTPPRPFMWDGSSWYAL